MTSTSGRNPGFGFIQFIAGEDFDRTRHAKCNHPRGVGDPIVVRDDRLIMTQELIANMLGVRREGVTEAAGKLQKLGVIEYHRGHIKVLDRT